MKIKVLIHRQLPDEPHSGALTGYVIQEGKRGSQLISRPIKSVDAAIQYVDARIQKEFKLTEPPEIEWVVEDPPQATP